MDELELPLGVFVKSYIEPDLSEQVELEQKVGWFDESIAAQVQVSPVFGAQWLREYWRLWTGQDVPLEEIRQRLRELKSR